MSEEIAAAAVETAEKAGMLGLGEATLDAVLGYLVVFIGLSLLMVVVIIAGKIMVSRQKKEAAAPATAAPAAALAPAVSAAPKELAPGSAGEVKIYDTDPRDAAMIMAIVANKLGKPLNELRFVSIKEVKEA